MLSHFVGGIIKNAERGGVLEAIGEGVSVFLGELQQQFRSAVCGILVQRCEIFVEQLMGEQQRLDGYTGAICDPLQRLYGNRLSAGLNARIDGLADAQKLGHFALRQVKDGPANAQQGPEFEHRYKNPRNLEKFAAG